jgi:hypothetical protein
LKVKSKWTYYRSNFSHIYKTFYFDKNIIMFDMKYNHTYTSMSISLYYDFFFAYGHSYFLIKLYRTMKHRRKCCLNEDRIPFKCCMCSLIINTYRQQKEKGEKKLFFFSIVFINLFKDKSICCFFLIYIFKDMKNHQIVIENHY